MSMTTWVPSYQGDRNGSNDPNAENQGAITITQTQDGGGNGLPPLPPPSLLPYGAAYGAAGHTAGVARGNGDRGEGMIANYLQMGYLATFHTGQLPSAMGTITTEIAKENNPAKQPALAETLHQFMTYDNINIWDLNGDYKYFRYLVAVPVDHMKKVTY